MKKLLLIVSLLFMVTTSASGSETSASPPLIGGISLDPGDVSNVMDSLAFVVISWAGSTDLNFPVENTPPYGLETSLGFFYFYDDDDNPTVKDMYDSLESDIPDLDFQWLGTFPNGEDTLYNVKWGDQANPDDVWEGGATLEPALQDKWVIDALQERMQGPISNPLKEWYWNEDMSTISLDNTTGGTSRLLEQTGTGSWQSGGNGGTVDLFQGFQTHILRIDPDAENSRKFWPKSDAELTFSIEFYMDGDLNMDGEIDGVDVSAIYANFTGPGVQVTYPYSGGDLDLDGDVDGVDVAVVFANFGNTFGGSAGLPTPEPGSLALIGVSFFALVRRRR